jgi:hypothetical protein
VGNTAKKQQNSVPPSKKAASSNFFRQIEESKLAALIQAYNLNLTNYNKK